MNRLKLVRRLLGCLLILFALSSIGLLWIRHVHSLEGLPAITNHKYKSQPYISAAITLQAMNRDTALQQVLKLAQSGKDDEQVFVLCRMIFSSRGTNSFRQPHIGRTIYLGGTDSRDWPLDPIELVNGVPFNIVWDYAIFATPESAEDYLSYCITNCDWNTFRFHKMSHDELKEALNKLLASPKWKRPLEQYEHEFLADQIE